MKKKKTKTKMAGDPPGLPYFGEDISLQTLLLLFKCSKR